MAQEKLKNFNEKNKSVNRLFMFVPAAYDWGLCADQSLGKLGSIGFSMTAIARPAEAIATMNINLREDKFYKYL